MLIYFYRMKSYKLLKSSPNNKENLADSCSLDPLQLHSCKTLAFSERPSKGERGSQEAILSRP